MKSVIHLLIINPPPNVRYKEEQVILFTGYLFTFLQSIDIVSYFYPFISDYCICNFPLVLQSIILGQKHSKWLANDKHQKYFFIWADLKIFYRSVSNRLYSSQLQSIK